MSEQTATAANPETYVNSKKVPEILKAKDFSEVLKYYIGTKVCLCCARYHWRGVLALANRDCVVLSDATQIDVTGACSADQPTSEDALEGDAIIKTDAIETMYQPKFSQAKLPGE